MAFAKNDPKTLDQAAEAQGGVILTEEQLEAVSGGIINSFMCPACGEQVNYRDNNRPFTCPYCNMPC